MERVKILVAFVSLFFCVIRPRSKRNRLLLSYFALNQPQPIHSVLFRRRLARRRAEERTGRTRRCVRFIQDRKDGSSSIFSRHYELEVWKS